MRRRLLCAAGLMALFVPTAAQASPVAEENYIRYLYTTALHRQPDAAGLQFWKERLRDDCAPEAGKLPRQFLGSAEFYAYYPILREPSRPSKPGERSIEEAVTQAYASILRNPERAGLAYWSQELKSGARTWVSVVAAITRSAEAVRTHGRVCAAASTSSVPAAPTFWRAAGSCPEPRYDEQGALVRATPQGDAVRFVAFHEEQQPDGTWREIGGPSAYIRSTLNPLRAVGPSPDFDGPPRRQRGYAESIHGKVSAMVTLPPYNARC